MRDEHWLVASAALYDVVQVAHACQWPAAPVQTVYHDEAPGAVLTDGFHQVPYHPFVVAVLHIGYFVEQVETQPSGRHGGISLCQHGPLVGTSVKRTCRLEDVLRLGRRIHAIAWSPVQIDAHMNAVLACPFHTVVQVCQYAFVHVVVVARSAPAPIGQGQTHKVEAPFMHPLPFFFAERLHIVCIEIVEQVESSPFLCAFGGPVCHGRCIHGLCPAAERTCP